MKSKLYFLAPQLQYPQLLLCTVVKRLKEYINIYIYVYIYIYAFNLLLISLLICVHTTFFIYAFILFFIWIYCFIILNILFYYDIYIISLYIKVKRCRISQTLVANRYYVCLKGQVAQRLFGLSFLITQFSVSITHNSKMVGPIAKSLFGKQ